MSFMFWFMLSILGIVTTFGFGTALNMVFKRWWLSTLLGLFFSIYLFVTVAAEMTGPEWILYVVGLSGAILASSSCRSLGKRGYSLFR